MYILHSHITLPYTMLNFILCFNEIEYTFYSGICIMANYYIGSNLWLVQIGRIACVQCLLGPGLQRSCSALEKMIIKYWSPLVPFKFSGNMIDISIVQCQYTSLIKPIIFKTPSLFVARNSFSIVCIAEKQCSVRVTHEWKLNTLQWAIMQPEKVNRISRREMYYIFSMKDQLNFVFISQEHDRFWLVPMI